MPDKMKIGVYKDNLSTGRGADRAVRNFTAGLAERGHDVALFEKAGLVAGLAGTFDVIVATGPNEALDLDRTGYFEREERAKVVLQLHLAPRGFFKWRHPLRNRAFKKAFDKADAAQVLCSCYKAEFRALAPHPDVEAIGNWTDMAAPDGHMPSEGSKTILYPAAALNKVKNQKLLIRSFAKVAADFPQWKVRLLGRDSTRYARECRTMIAGYGLEDRIEIAGFTDDLAGEYSRAAFVAFPSVLEGFPLAVLEAAEFGLCALVHAGLPGVTDIVKNGETGLVAGQSIAEYAEGLVKLMSGVGLVREFGAKAREYCRSDCSRAKILDKWEALLRKTVAS